MPCCWLPCYNARCTICHRSSPPDAQAMLSIPPPPPPACPCAHAPMQVGPFNHVPSTAVHVALDLGNSTQPLFSLQPPASPPPAPEPPPPPRPSSAASDGTNSSGSAVPATNSSRISAGINSSPASRWCNATIYVHKLVGMVSEQCLLLSLHAHCPSCHLWHQAPCYQAHPGERGLSTSPAAPPAGKAVCCHTQHFHA